MSCRLVPEPEQAGWWTPAPRCPQDGPQKQGGHHPDPKPSHRMGGENPKARDAKLQVRGHFSGPGALYPAGGLGRSTWRGSQGQSEGEGSAVTRLARVLPAAPARPPPGPPAAVPGSADIHLGACLAGWITGQGSGCLDGHSEASTSRTSARACMRDETRADEVASGARADHRLGHRSLARWRGRPGPRQIPDGRGKTRSSEAVLPLERSGRAGRWLWDGLTSPVTGMGPGNSDPDPGGAGSQRRGHAREPSGQTPARGGLPATRNGPEEHGRARASRAGMTPATPAPT